jgi:protein transport protein SEC61 subunit gamma-like protein
MCSTNPAALSVASPSSLAPLDGAGAGSAELDAPDARCSDQYIEKLAVTITPMEVPFDLASYVRVLKLASTPSWEEFSQISKVAGAGILLVGLLGFLIFVIMTLLPGGI